MDKARLIVATMVMVAFAAFAVFLVANADTKDASEWQRWVYVFGGVEAIAFAAVGWVFGREVNRQRAEKAEVRADNATEKAAKERETGAQLAGMVIAGGSGREKLESMGPRQSGLSEAVAFARRHYSAE